MSFSKETKKLARREADNTCACCGVKVRRSNELECHHEVPQSLGGSNTRVNLVTLCGEAYNDCHEKYDKLVLEEGILFNGQRLADAPDEMFRSHHNRFKGR